MALLTMRLRLRLRIDESRMGVRMRGMRRMKRMMKTVRPS